MTMTVIQDQIADVRERIGEPIPAGGTETDTLFTNEQITSWINQSNSLDAAALEGWKRKAAHWAGLVNVVDGAAARQFSDLFDHAQAMVKLYTKLAQGPASGRTRVGRIVRP